MMYFAWGFVRNLTNFVPKSAQFDPFDFTIDGFRIVDEYIQQILQQPNRR